MKQVYRALAGSELDALVAYMKSLTDRIPPGEGKR